MKQSGIKADLLVCSRNVFRGDTSRPAPGVVGIRGKRILGVAERGDVDAWIGPSTRIIELGDALVIPGFHDSHIHLWLSLLLKESLDLTGVPSEEKAAQSVCEYCRSHPRPDWIIGHGWHQANWGNRLPSRRSLDRAVADRPVFLLNATGHGAWVNSRALDLAKIDAASEDPPFGKIEKDERGIPTGYLYERALGIVGKLALKLPEKMMRKGFKQFLSAVARVGVTSVDDMFPITGMSLGDPRLYADFENEEALSVRINFYTALTHDVSEPERFRTKYNSNTLRFGGLKEFIDGVATTHTALLVDPYQDQKETCGKPLLSPEYLRTAVANADEHGFKVRLHAVGDGAVRLALDMFEMAQRINSLRDSRHCVEHVEIIHPSDIDRFAKLGVIPSIQPDHMAITRSLSDHPFLPILGTARERYFWVNRSLRETGSPTPFGTDYPVTSIDPLRTIHRAVTRRFDDGEPAEGWNPHERISTAEALVSYTGHPAYNAFREYELGMIRAGFLADLAAVDRNILSLHPDEMLGARVILSVMDGKVVYEL